MILDKWVQDIYFVNREGQDGLHITKEDVTQMYKSESLTTVCEKELKRGDVKRVGLPQVYSLSNRCSECHLVRVTEL